MRRSELPQDLGDAFTVAAARSSGVSSGRLQARSLSAPFHGARTTRRLTQHEQLQLLIDTLPDHAFACGPTAAVLHDLPLPAPLQLTAFTEPTIGVPLPHNRIRRPAVTGRALRVTPQQLTEVRGIRCTGLTRTSVDLAPALDLARLVAVTDHLIARRGGRLTLGALHEAHRQAGSGRGSRTRADALALCVGGSESPRESETRVALVLAGLPTPETNVEIWDGGRFVARVDMLYRDRKIVIEYDGEYHFTHAQWQRDRSRRAALAELGYHIVVVASADLADPASLTARIRRLLGG
ncbi:endonuclease domain-containing protein [Microbacterium sp. NPDC057407]|uniref:endonuclease domain-containing protein n=1 Tax=Microbacterium sp. NPDC057407 TaxID=3346120 RepID=UPI00366BF7C4